MLAAAALCATLVPSTSWAQAPVSDPGASVAPVSSGPRFVSGSTYVVGNGDSWFSMRSRICPVEDLQQANPALAQRSLRAGDEIRAPFVPVSVLEKAERARLEAEQQSAAARAEADERAALAQQRAVDLEARTNELAIARAELRATLDGQLNARRLEAALAAGFFALLACLLFVASSLYAARRSGQLREEKLKQLESEYTHLRRSITDLDVQLQRRMLKLLSWHETRVLTEREVEEATAPVVEMARKLKERHAS